MLEKRKSYGSCTDSILLVKLSDQPLLCFELLFHSWLWFRPISALSSQKLGSA